MKPRFGLWCRSSVWLHGSLACGLALMGLATVGVRAARAADEWIRVATDGLGDATRLQVDAIAVYGEYVYIAVHQAISPSGVTSILRAWLREDHIWTDVTPPWGAAGEVSGLEIVDGVLHAATTDGQLWQRGTSSPWSRVSRPWVGSPEILHLGGWDPGDGSGERLCLVRIGQVVACRPRGGAWTDLGAPPLAEPSSAATGKLKGFEDELYLGIGGAVAGSRGCEAWRYGLGPGWRPVTTDCFGGADGGLTWLTDMEVYAGHIYFGTGGHTTGDTTTLVVRARDGVVEDVTPYDLYSCFLPAGGVCPVHYNAFAVTSTNLYVGTRTGGLGLPLADVLRSNNGEDWTRSNEPGFGETLNDTVTAMGSRDAYVYAGLISGEGFQVWRRNFPVFELLPSLYEHLWEVKNAALAARLCLIPAKPCPPPWEQLFRPLEEIRLGLELANYSQDDPVPIKEARAAMTQVRQDFDTAQLLAAFATKETDPKKARRLRLQAAGYLNDGLALAEKTARRLGKAGRQ